jgi:hypothetical protein
MSQRRTRRQSVLKTRHARRCADMANAPREINLIYPPCQYR